MAGANSKPTGPETPGPDAGAFDESMRKAAECMTNQDWESARRHALEAKAIRTDDPDMLWLLAAAEARGGRLVAAENSILSLMEQVPDSAEIGNRLAEIRSLKAKWHDHPYAQEYRAQLAMHMDFPRNIGIETVGRCNATCGFCPHSDLDRKFLEMPDALFDKILADLSRIPPHVPIRIFPNLVNEPFMDKRIFARLFRINEVLPTAGVQIFTNFNVLPKGYLEGLRGIRNLEQINISFNAANPQEYHDVMGIDFERTVTHIRTVLDDNRRQPYLQHPLVLSRVSDGTDRDMAYARECRELLSDFDEDRDFVAHVKSRTNWLGATDDTQSAIPYSLPCGAWLDINVMCTGVVPLCCIDANGEHAIGNVATNSLLEIYNSPSFKGLRTTESVRETASPCGECALLQ